MKLVLMGDLHYHDADRTIPEWVEARDSFYSTLLERFLDIDADAHISLGDLTNYGTRTELEGVYGLLSRRADRTFYHVLGNHDLYGSRRSDVLDVSGKARYRAIESDRAVLAIIDTAKEMDFLDWGGWVDEEQLHWLEGVVRASGERPLLVFAHHPVYATTKRSDKDKGSIHPSVDVWSVLKQKQGVGMYFNGHTHVDSIATREQWTFVQLSACLDQHAFRVVDIGEDDIRVAAVDLDEETLRQAAPVLHANMQHFRPTAEARGEAADRECAVRLDSAAPRIVSR